MVAKVSSVGEATLVIVVSFKWACGTDGNEPL